MKKIFTFLVAFLAIAGNAVWGQETMEIRSWEDFLKFRDAVKENPNTNAILMNDIVANENILGDDGLPNIKYEEGSGHHDYQDLNLWSWNSTTFTYGGTFDGNNKTISGIYSIGDALFGTLSENAIIKDLGIIDSYFRIKNSSGAAVFCGTNRGTISYCWNEGTLEVYSSGYGGGNAGAICSMNYGTIENCYNKGLIYSIASIWEGMGSTGGICGKSSGVIQQCYNEGTLDISATTTHTDISKLTFPSRFIGGY